MNNKLIKLKLSLLLLGGFLSFCSCTEGVEGSGKALVNIRLIDAPGDFDEAWIEIIGVEILQSRNRGGNDTHSVFVEYQRSNQPVDISKLVGEGVLLIGRTEIPVGNISQMRLILGEDHFLMKDGERMMLNLKSPGEADIEINVDYTVEESLSYDIYLDFELEKSIISTSDTTQFLLSPVVRSFVRSETSEMGGSIRPVEARPVLFAVQGTDTVTTLTDPRGAYLFRGLSEGKFTLFINPRKPYLDTMFTVQTEIGKHTMIEDIVLRPSGEN
ncbi:MAG: DUF4382 domain-containing protein [Anditalea sp.]